MVGSLLKERPLHLLKVMTPKTTPIELNQGSCTPGEKRKWVCSTVCLATTQWWRTPLRNSSSGFWWEYSSSSAMCYCPCSSMLSWGGSWYPRSYTSFPSISNTGLLIQLLLAISSFLYELCTVYHYSSALGVVLEVAPFAHSLRLSSSSMEAKRWVHHCVRETGWKYQYESNGYIGKAIGYPIFNNILLAVDMSCEQLLRWA